MQRSALLVCLLGILQWGPAFAETSTPFRILAFGDSNTWGWTPTGDGKRFADTERWTGVLQSELGSGYTVITDGLVARRTNVDGLSVPQIDGSFLNGAKTLPAAIVRNAPVDLVIIFLGTNDLQLGIARSADAVAEAVAGLAELVRSSEKLLYSSYPAPSDVWIIVPPALGDLSASPLKGLFAVGQSESKGLSDAFQKMAADKQLTLFDLEVIAPGGVGADGIHLSAATHQKLGSTLAEAIKLEKPLREPQTEARVDR